jgi:hypothetical protein
MKISANQSFEVRCHHCDVSFPVGTKRCIHCGEKPTAEPPPTQFREHGWNELLSQESEAAPGELPSRMEPQRELEEETEPEGGLRQTLPRVAMSLVWVVLLVVVSIYRACSGG